MGIFRLSTQFQKDHFSSTVDGLGHATSTTGLRDNGARLYIMKGTIPTQNELDNFSASSWRSGDVLILKTVQFNSGDSPFDATAMLFKVDLEQRVASASGLAEWFQWRGGNGSNAFSNPSFVGSITDVGSGGDMTLYNRNVISGNTYDIGPMSFDFSKREYTY